MAGVAEGWAFTVVVSRLVGWTAVTAMPAPILEIRRHSYHCTLETAGYLALSESKQLAAGGSGLACPVGFARKQVGPASCL